MSVLSLLTLLASWLLDLGGKSHANESVLRLKLLGEVNRVVYESEPLRLSSSDLGFESEWDNRVWSGLIKLGDLFTDISLRDSWTPWVDHLDNHLLSVEKLIGENLSRSDSNDVTHRDEYYLGLYPVNQGMEDQWLLSAIYDDDLVEKLKVRSSTSSRSTSINVPSLENEFLSSSSGSRVSDDLYLHPIEENREPFKLIGKPLPSTTGRFLSLLANHFQITCNGSIIHQYYIRFDPDIPSKKLNRTILRTLQEQNPGLIECPLVFDGIHTVYSTELINVKEVNNSVINVAGVVNTKESPNLFKL